MKIFVDADACPVIAIVERLARQAGVPVELITDVNHQLQSDYAEVVTVGQGPDAVDYALINRTSTGDIVVTQDYGLAALALAKGARAIDQNGRLYTADNIDQLLLERHLGQKQRRAGQRGARIRPRTKKNDSLFEKQFGRLLMNKSI